MSGTVHPGVFSRRSFVYRRLVAAGCTWRERGGAAVAATIPGANAGGLGLADLSPLARCGIKGADALDWLRRQGWPVPDDNNHAGRTSDGAVVARLSDGELLVLDAPVAPSPALQALMESLARRPTEGDLPPRCYAVPRADSHVWFLLCGAAGPECLAKVCGVDMRPHRFPDLSVAQTSLARLSAVIIRVDGGAPPAFYILADSASALYLWDCLVDAMAEFDGRLLGLDDLPAC